MDLNDSDYELGSQTLREIEFQENAMLNRPETEVIEGSQDFVQETPKNFSIQHKSLSDRFRLATQKQNDKRKFEKTKSESSIMDSSKKNRKSSGEALTLSRMIQKEIEDIENIDFHAWYEIINLYNSNQLKQITF